MSVTINEIRTMLEVSDNDLFEIFNLDKIMESKPYLAERLLKEGIVKFVDLSIKKSANNKFKI